MALSSIRPPRQEAYSGDVFLIIFSPFRKSSQLGEGSMTTSPIVETQAGDVSAYIRTIVVSISDGQNIFISKLT